MDYITKLMLAEIFVLLLCLGGLVLSLAFGGSRTVEFDTGGHPVVEDEQDGQDETSGGGRSKP